MSELWYYRKAGQLFGPMTRSALSEIAAEGGLAANDEVRSGHSGWQPAASQFEISQPSAGSRESSMLDSFHDILGEAPAAPVAEAVPEAGPVDTPAADVYFCRIQGEQTGPYSIDDLQELVNDGQLQKHDRYMLDGSRCWLPCSELTDLDFSTAPTDEDEDDVEDDEELVDDEDEDDVEDDEELVDDDDDEDVEDVEDDDDPVDEDEDDDELVDDEDDPVDEDDDDDEFYDEDDDDEDVQDDDDAAAAAMLDEDADAVTGAAAASSWDAQETAGSPDATSAAAYSSPATDVALSPPVAAPVPSRPSLYQEALRPEKESSTSTREFTLPPAKNMLIGVVVAALIFVGIWLLPKGGGMIHGQVNIDGAPVPVGIVSITPSAGTKGPSLSFALIDGKFEATQDVKLDEGTYTVSVTVGNPLKMPVKELEGTPFESLNGSRFQTQIDTRTMESPSIDLEFKASDVVVPKKGGRRKKRRR